MKVNDCIVIDKAKWSVKYPSTTVINRVEKTHGYKFVRGALPDRSGWGGEAGEVREMVLMNYDGS